MEIRLKIWELIILTSGLIAAGVFLGLFIAGKVTSPMGYVYFAGTLLPAFSIIMRNRYKLNPKN
jgi:hypothetical protein